MQQETKSIFKYPTLLLPPPVWGLLGHWKDGGRVCGVLLLWFELRSHHTRPHHRERFCLAQLVPGLRLACRNSCFVMAETLEQMLSLGPGAVIQCDEVPFCGLFLLESGWGLCGSVWCAARACSPFLSLAGSLVSSVSHRPSGQTPSAVLVLLSLSALPCLFSPQSITPRANKQKPLKPRVWEKTEHTGFRGLFSFSFKTIF